MEFVICNHLQQLQKIFRNNFKQGNEQSLKWKLYNTCKRAQRHCRKCQKTSYIPLKRLKLLKKIHKITDGFNVTSMEMSMKFFTEIENTLLETLRNHTQENANLYKILSKSVGDIMLTEISWA